MSNATPSNDAASNADPSDLSFEQAMSQLQSLVTRMESGQAGLKESLDDYRRGTALVKHCRALLDSAEQEIVRLSAADR